VSRLDARAMRTFAVQSVRFELSFALTPFFGQSHGPGRAGDEEHSLGNNVGQVQLLK
jgi:hypothetical protein